MQMARMREMIFLVFFMVKSTPYNNLIFNGDIDDGPGCADGIATFGVKIVEHGCAFIRASRKLPTSSLARSIFEPIGIALD